MQVRATLSLMKLMKPYPAAPPVNLFLMTLMERTLVSPMDCRAFRMKSSSM